MLALYLATLGFGSTLILASLLLGGHGNDDADHGDHDHDHDHDHDGAEAEAEAEAHADHGVGDEGHHVGEIDHVWLPFLSLRFWTFGMATFGLAGTLLTLLSVPQVLAAVVSALVGLGFGTLAAWFFRALRTDAVSGATSLDHVAGEEARVVLAIRPGQPGKIVLQTLAGRVEMLATTRDLEPIQAGSAVIVAQVRGGVADVSRLTPTAGATPGHKSKQRAEQRASLDRTEG